jgi:hypothetical protein
VWVESFSIILLKYHPATLCDLRHKAIGKWRTKSSLLVAGATPATSPQPWSVDRLYGHCSGSANGLPRKHPANSPLPSSTPPHPARSIAHRPLYPNCQIHHTYALRSNTLIISMANPTLTSSPRNDLPQHPPSRRYATGLLTHYVASSPSHFLSSASQIRERRTCPQRLKFLMHFAVFPAWMFPRGFRASSSVHGHSRRLPLGELSRALDPPSLRGWLSRD